MYLPGLQFDGPRGPLPPIYLVMEGTMEGAMEGTMEYAMEGAMEGAKEGCHGGREEDI